MKNISQYSFVDCLLIDFSVNKTCSRLEIVSEAYFPFKELSDRREKGRIKIIVSGISYIEMKIKEEFVLDILSPYSQEGDDTRANEVYDMKNEKNDTAWDFSLKTDFLDMKLGCKKLSIQELGVTQTY